MKQLAFIAAWAFLGSAMGAQNHVNGVVKSLNDLQGDVRLTAGSNVTIVPVNNTIRISARSGVQEVNGMAGSLTIAAGENINISSTANRIEISSSITNNSSAGTNGWHRTGDTCGAGDFLGTLNNTALEFKVNGSRALRLEPNDVSPNVVGGFSGNQAGSSVLGGTIAGGGARTVENRLEDHYGSIGGGYGNLAVGGGTVAGGGLNHAGPYGSIGGGWNNAVFGEYGGIGGGSNNFNEATGSTIAGGGGNRILANATASAIGGGWANGIGTNSPFSSLGGGSYNIIQFDSGASTIGGGSGNFIASGAPWGMIPGGRSNTVTRAFGFAAGNRAAANHPGAFVWADSNDFTFASTVPDSFSVRAIGGVRFISAIDGLGNAAAGVTLPTGGGGWSTLSDRAAKDKFADVDPAEILEKVTSLPMKTWQYKTQDPSVRHIGPTAQDFHAAFNVGEDDKHISSIDADGVALAAIQGLSEIVKEKNARIEALEKSLAELKTLVNALANQKEGKASK